MKRKIVLFIILAFAIDWILWIATTIAFGPVTEGAGLWSLVMPLAMFGPMVAALIVRAVPGEDIERGWRPKIRGHVRVYLLAWFAPAALSVLGAALYFLAFPGEFDAEAGRFSAAAQAQLGISSDKVPLMLAVQIAYAVVVAPLINMLVAIGEEAGWRGFLFPALGHYIPERKAALLTGAIWGLWHAPLIAEGYNYGTDYAGFPVTGILMMVAGCTAFGMLLAFLRSRTGSVWAPALAHGAMNATAGLGLLFSSGTSTIMGPSPLGLAGFLPSLVLAVFLWRHMDGKRTEGQVAKHLAH